MIRDTFSRLLAGSALAVGLLALSHTASAAPVAISSPPPLAPGFNVEWVQVDVAPHSIADAQNALAGTGGFNVIERVTELRSTIGVNDLSVPFADASADMFAIRVSGYINLSAGTYTFGGLHDDGLLLSIGGEDVIVFNNDTATVLTTSVAYALAAGVYAFEAISWEQGGTFDLFLGTVDVAGDLDLIEGFHAVRSDVPEPGSLALTGLALLGLVGAGRRRRR